MGFALVMITLVVVLNLVRSRTGRAIMAIRDNRIAAESVGINVTKYKLLPSSPPPPWQVPPVPCSA